MLLRDKLLCHVPKCFPSFKKKSLIDTVLHFKLKIKSFNKTIVEIKFLFFSFPTENLFKRFSLLLKFLMDSILFKEGCLRNVV